ncbi:VRR-NUC domain-containing protein [Delftia sp. ZNC0008]|uniref:VRR-NUC domain-containing protein n=1 Tax=Delftia sp. ZNC0008 TaxID=1339242 RepID=UPI0006473976|nr:VRR-NUC domain-containing protein [Delftia sp. ZNC0008]
MPRESAIERADRKNHKAAGRLLLKFVSPGRNGMPDDILLNPIPPEHQEIVARYFRFVEYKKPKGTPRPDQLRRHAELRALGFTVDVIDSQST